MQHPATIQEIKEIRPIEGRDRIELAKVAGWWSIVRKDEFKVGDPVVFIEIDSIIPRKPWSEFLFKNDKQETIIRTYKVGGAISQGLCLPISILPNNVLKTFGFDVSTIIGASHYERPDSVSMGGNVVGQRPAYTPKTDETQAQSRIGCIDELRGKEAYITVKCDGTSSTSSFKNGRLDLCSRSQSYKLDDNDNLYVKVPKKYKIDQILDDLKLNVAIQGEICGPGVQGNRLGLNQHQLFVFDVYDIEEQKYWGWHRAKNFCDQHGLTTVPLIEIVQCFDYSFEQLLAMTNRKYEGTNNLCEGIVVRSAEPCYSRALEGRMSFKILNAAFLIKNAE